MLSVMNLIKSFFKTHRAFLSRTFIVLLVALSVAAASPVQVLLDFAAEQVERQAMNERLISNMAYLHRTNFPQTPEDQTSLIRVEYIYTGRAAAMEEVAIYLRSLKWDGEKPVDKP